MKTFKKGEMIILDGGFEGEVLCDQTEGDTMVVVTMNDKNGKPDGYEYAVTADKLHRRHSVEITRLSATFPELNMSKVADRLNINTSQFRHYLHGDFNATPERKRQIQEGLRELGYELMHTTIN